MAIFFSERKRKGSAAAGGISFSCATKVNGQPALAGSKVRQHESVNLEIQDSERTACVSRQESAIARVRELGDSGQ